jgi:hypothetical protein
MLGQLLEGALLAALSVAIHGLILGWIIWRLQQAPVVSRSIGPGILLLVRVAVWCLLAHVVEIAAWALYYWWQDVMPDWELAVYFSAVTYATIGYGDVTPPAGYRLLASIEGLTGILMCAWSGGFFFAVVTRVQKSAVAEGGR